MSLRNAMAHRNLLYLLSLKELRTRYKKSILGWAWSLLNPLTQMGIFTVVFIYVFKANPLPGDPSGLRNFPLYFLSGILPFNFFTISVSSSIGNVQGGASLIKKVRFPNEHLVFSVITAQFVTLLIELTLLTTVMLLVGQMVLPWLPTLAVVLILLAIFTSGVALMLSAANVFYHDVNYLWSIVSQMLFYVTPIIYFPAILDLRPLELLANYGPTGSFITAVHNIMYDRRFPGFGRMLELTVMAFGMFFLGAWVFARLAPKFAEEM
jgi:ABC-type polysaccharide/polyol phosphate export permease